MLKGMPENLFDVLERMSLDNDSLFQEATWLISDFDDEVWLMDFDGVRRTIEWRVRFGAGMLTDAQYTTIRNLFKSFLIVQTAVTKNNRRVCSDATAKHLVACACRIVDYFLLRQDELKIVRYGLRLVGKNDIATLLHRFENGPTDVEAVYDWKATLARWLDARLDVHRAHAELLVAKHSVFTEISVPQEDWILAVEPRKMSLWRAVLWLEGCYNRAKNQNYRFIPSTRKLAATIYAETIAGKTHKPIFEELCLYPIDKYVRECPGVDVRTGTGDGPTPAYLARRRNALDSLILLEAAGFDVPIDALDGAREYKPVSPERMATPGRYRNPPFWQVMDGMRDGLAFCEERGEALLNSYINILAAAKGEEVTPYVLLLGHDIREFLTRGAADMGVTQWCLRTHAGSLSLGRRYIRAREGERWSKEKFYGEFRRGRGLLQNIQVLYGSFTHLVGPLTARRQMELLRLPIKGCLDTSRTFIHFGNRKSGAAGLLEKEVRPIPPAVEIPISIIEAFHCRLVKEGLSQKAGLLFDLPGWQGMRIPTVPSFNSCLDAFCDYFQTPLTIDGRRHYLREHQFRRFFIISFFFSARIGDLDTLRWFVAHVDAEHLWHYLTNNVSGDLYREAAAYFLTDELLLPEESRVIEMHENVHDHLAALVQERFGTRKFSLVDADALEGYLESKIGSDIEVEPEFFSFAVGFPYKIVCRLKGGR